MQKRTPIKIILLYSPKKNIAKGRDEKSTLYPATSSASASGRSKGVRFVSANIATRNTALTGNRGGKNQILTNCENTIRAKFNEPERRTTGSNTSVIATSYEIICAAERRAPIKAYFELLAQPARIMLYTVNELSARIIRRLCLRLLTVSSSARYVNKSDFNHRSFCSDTAAEIRKNSGVVDSA